MTVAQGTLLYYLPRLKLSSSTLALARGGTPSIYLSILCAHATCYLPWNVSLMSPTFDFQFVRGRDGNDTADDRTGIVRGVFSAQIHGDAGVYHGWRELAWCAPVIIIILVLPPGVVPVKLCSPNAWHSRWRCR